MPVFGIARIMLMTAAKCKADWLLLEGFRRKLNMSVDGTRAAQWSASNPHSLQSRSATLPPALLEDPPEAPGSA